MRVAVGTGCGVRAGWLAAVLRMVGAVTVALLAVAGAAQARETPRDPGETPQLTIEPSSGLRGTVVSVELRGCTGGTVGFADEALRGAGATPQESPPVDLALRGEGDAFVGEYRIAVTDSDGTGSFFGDCTGGGRDILEFEVLPDRVGDVVVERLEGASRVGTAAAISRALFSPTRTVFLARADDYADALAVASLAYTKLAPVLLVPPDELPGSVANALSLLNPEEVVLLGGPGAISGTVERELSFCLPGAPDLRPGPVRDGGADRPAAPARAALLPVRGAR